MTASEFTTYVVPTIDAEGVHGASPFDALMLGRTDDGGEYGATHLARIFHEYGLAATFFLDIYEHTLYGEDCLKELCDQLLLLGQDIQLHTHPSWRDDPRDTAQVRELKRDKCFFPQDKDFLYKCSLDEQREIIGHGVDKLRQWTGNNPVAHRAGGYGLNEETLKVLHEVGITVDSSACPFHSNSKLQLEINVVSQLHGVTQLPITGYAVDDTIVASLLRWHRTLQFQKTDLDQSSLTELLWFLDTVRSSGGILTLFMHSYSLLRFDRRFNCLWHDQQEERKLRDFIGEVLQRPGVKVISVSDYHQMASSEAHGQSSGFLPRFQRTRSLASVAKKVIGRRLTDWRCAMNF